MRSFKLAVALATLAGQPATAADEAPLEFSPTSKWVMDYDADSCALRRTFGDAERQALLELRAYAPGIWFQVTVASGTLKSSGNAPEVGFEPGSELWKPQNVIIGSFGDTLKGVVYYDSLRPDRDSEVPWTEAQRDAREAEISALAVNHSFERDLSLRTGALHAPMTAMRACLDDLLSQWGVDVAAHRTLSRWVTPKDYESWVRRVQEHYPPTMLNVHRNGYVRIRLMVGTDGRPSSCNVQVTVRDPEFQQTACDILMDYAQFEPALDARGQAIASFYVTSVFYQLSP